MPNFTFWNHSGHSHCARLSQSGVYRPVATGTFCAFDVKEADNNNPVIHTVKVLAFIVIIVRLLLKKLSPYLQR
jgi:hypothetical protein